MSSSVVGGGSVVGCGGRGEGRGEGAGGSGGEGAGFVSNRADPGIQYFCTVTAARGEHQAKPWGAAPVRLQMLNLNNSVVLAYVLAYWNSRFGVSRFSGVLPTVESVRVNRSLYDKKKSESAQSVLHLHDELNAENYFQELALC